MDRELSFQGKLTQANCQENQIPEPLPRTLHKSPVQSLDICKTPKDPSTRKIQPTRQCCIRSSKAWTPPGTRHLLCARNLAKRYTHTIFYNPTTLLEGSAFIPISKLKLLPTLLPYSKPRIELLLC